VLVDAREASVVELVHLLELLMYHARAWLLLSFYVMRSISQWLTVTSRQLLTICILLLLLPRLCSLILIGLTLSFCLMGC